MRSLLSTRQTRTMRPTMLQVTCVLGCICLCLVQLSEGNDTTQVYNKKAVHPKVFLKPPANVTVELRSAHIIIIRWDAPNVYPLHSINDTFIKRNDGDYNLYKNETSSTTTALPVQTTTPVPNSDSSPSPTAKDSTSSSTAPPLLPKPKCMTEDKFKDLDVFEVLLDSVDHAVKTVDNKKDGEKEGEKFNSSYVPVDFDKGCVEKYMVHYKDTNKGNSNVLEVAANKTELHLFALETHTNYEIYVSAKFSSGDILNSSVISSTTLKNHTLAVCNCSKIGALEDAKCDPTQKHGSWCKCKPQYTGDFCEFCKPGYYRSASYFRCNRCPCSPLATVQNTCHFREGYLICDSCSPNYIGHLCQSCVNGFYRYHGRCIPCDCNGNNDLRMTRMCDPYTGACTKCINNTTGIRCGKCMPGYVREKVHHQHCVHKSSVSEHRRTPTNGLIAAICIGVILAICAVVGFIIYRRCRLYPQRKPFWTVELKEDHDSINFSSVPGQDYIRHNAADVQDMDFYENQQGRSGNKSSSKYSQLKEVM